MSNIRKCRRCNLEVMDQTYTCPLCRSILEDDLNEDEIMDTYPKIEFNVKVYKRIKQDFIWASILISIFLAVINFVTYNGMMWSLLAIFGIVYVGVTVVYSVLNNSNLAKKILVQTIAISALCIGIDNVIGYSGWSCNYVVPGMILFANFSILLCILISRMNWQSYFMYQITITVLSFIPLILLWVGLISKPLLPILTGSVSLVMLIITIIFGDRSVKNELIRRFNT